MKIILKFPHVHEGKDIPAGSTLDLPDPLATWLLAQRIDDQPCAVPANPANPVNPVKNSDS